MTKDTSLGRLIYIKTEALTLRMKQSLKDPMELKYHTEDEDEG